ncbi:MAG: MBOAT family protein, partial [Leptospiraceae bacterium]|nr:MBOAT family protein [Leptospiraceae bacterium]
FLNSVLYDITGIIWFKEFGTSLKIILPLAISFYTFQILAFTIDIYRGKYTEDISLLNYMVFIMFFPQLIAGPIMRANEFLPQLQGKTEIDFKSDYIYKGMLLVALGIVKKVLIADNIAGVIDPVWQNPSQYSSFELFIAIHGFTWQIYGDFGGYTDVARGAAYLLGYEIPENFKAPFLSASPREMWQRWHITLSTWLRDYLYIPLGGSRVGEFRNQFNLVLTFVLGGLWHGAAWTYVIWGFFHGFFLVLQRIMEKLGFKQIFPSFPGKIVSIFFTYHLFFLGAIPFRSKNMSDFFLVSEKVFLWNSNIKSSILTETVIGLCFLALLIQIFEYKEYFPRVLWKIRPVFTPLIFLLLLILIGLYSGTGKEFVYFQF